MIILLAVAKRRITLKSHKNLSITNRYNEQNNSINAIERSILKGTQEHIDNVIVPLSIISILAELLESKINRNVQKKASYLNANGNERVISLAGKNERL